MAQQVNRTTAVNPYNVAVTQQSGKVGNVRYIQRNGLTYVRSASNSVVNNARSDKQMEQRMKFASLSALYSLFGSHLHTAFQNKARNMSDFNAFMQANQGEGAYMSKDEKAAGMVIPLPAVIARGSLSGTCLSLSGSDVLTDIEVASGTTISTIKALTAAIVAKNADWKAGDQLTIMELISKNDRIVATFSRVILSATDTATPDSRIKVFGTAIAITPSANSQGVAIIHTNAGSKSSNSAIVLTAEGQAVYDEYTSDAQYEIARATYGEANSRYLRAGEESSTPTVLSGIATAVDKDGQPITASTQLKNVGNSSGGGWRVSLYENVGTLTDVALIGSDGATYASQPANVSVSGKVITVNAMSAITTETATVASIRVRCSAGTFTKVL